MTLAARASAGELLPLAGLHHLALFAILVVAWTRRDTAGRMLSVYFAAAFGTAAVSLLAHTGTRIDGAFSLALCLLWLAEVARPRIGLEFARTPRTRLVAMSAAGAFAVSYPGYSGALPSFIFSPLGVLLAPTLLAATSLLNASCGRTNHVIHWSMAGVGAAVAVAGLASGGWEHVPLLVVSVYAAPLLLGRGRLRPEAPKNAPGSVREVSRRMHSRRSILPGPRDAGRKGRRARVPRK